MSDTWAVQVALMALLNGDAELPPFHDVAATGTQRPYGSYGSPVATRRGVMGKLSATRHSVTLDWWGDHETTDPATGRVTRHSNSQVAAYAKRAKELLNASPVALQDGTMVRLRWVSDTYLPETENNVRRVQQLYSIDTE